MINKKIFFHTITIKYMKIISQKVWIKKEPFIHDKFFLKCIIVLYYLFLIKNN